MSRRRRATASPRIGRPREGSPPAFPSLRAPGPQCAAGGPEKGVSPNPPRPLEFGPLMLATIRHAWNRLRTIARPFRGYDRRRWAAGMAGGILALLLLMAWLNVVINRIGGRFW